jgi:hypothetical protein
MNYNILGWSVSASVFTSSSSLLSGYQSRHHHPVGWYSRIHLGTCSLPIGGCVKTNYFYRHSFSSDSFFSYSKVSLFLLLLRRV